MDNDQFFDVLEKELPTKQKLELSWIPTEAGELYVHRLSGPDLLQFIEAAGRSGESKESTFQFATELVAKSVGGESGPGYFDSDRGRRWLGSYAMRTMELFQVAQAFNELTQSSEQRKND
jgi:hypothetical protein